MTSYSGVIIVGYDITLQSVSNVAYVDKGTSNSFVAMCCSLVNYCAYGRNVTVDNSGVTFTNGVLPNGVGGSNAAVPKQIYGI